MALVSFGPVVITDGDVPVNLADALFPDRAPGTPVPLSSLTLMADGDNSGQLYVFFTSDGADHKGDKEGLACLLQPCGFTGVDPDQVKTPCDRITYGPDGLSYAGIDLQNVWVQADSNGDSIIVSGTR